MNILGDYTSVLNCMYMLTAVATAYLFFFLFYSRRRNRPERVNAQQQLAMRQILNSYAELRFKHIIFCITNIASLWCLYILSEKLKTEDMTVDKFTELLKAIAALFAPFVTYVIQGYIFPRGRKINILRHVLFKKETLNNYEEKVLYDDEK